MLPYYPIPSIEIYGPIGIHPFGVLVATGILVGTWFGMRRARQAGINPDHIRGGILWSIVVGFVMAHLVAILAYFPERLSREGIIVLFKIWDGISSFGGFIGGFIGLLTYLYLLKRPILPRVDIVLQAFVVGWIFGRLGCTVAFDHPGLVTDFFLAMPFPHDGQPRHNLGFYEFLWTLLVIFPTLLILHRRNAPAGSHVAAVFLTYCPFRFGIDFLRATDLQSADKRYLGLTPAQYGAIVIFLIGIGLIFYIRAADPAKYAEPGGEDTDSNDESDGEAEGGEKDPQAS